MNATQQLHDLGQSLWLDNMTRALLTSSTLSRSIREFAVTRLTSNPTIFDQAAIDIGGGPWARRIPTRRRGAPSERASHVRSTRGLGRLGRPRARPRGRR